jgi:hypothetical protein
MDTVQSWQKLHLPFLSFIRKFQPKRFYKIDPQLGTDVKKRLELKEHPDKGVYVPGKLDACFQA